MRVTNQTSKTLTNQLAFRLVVKAPCDNKIFFMHVNPVNYTIYIHILMHYSLS